MEGITHSAFREKLCQLDGIDYCVTEFIRVTTQLHSKKVFYRYCPELLKLSLTQSSIKESTSRSACLLNGPRVNNKTPIIIQLLGSNPEALLVNAERAVELGAKGIDLNFGCPAKTVNRNQGGAYLLQFPDQIGNITKHLRTRIPKNIKVSAKIRLGFTDTILLKDVIQAIDEAQLSWLTVHCRTKKNGYAPPAHWEYLPQIREWTKTPLVANGDIFSIKNLIECHAKTNCQNFMIGRGVIYNPMLFSELHHFLKERSLGTHCSDNDLLHYKIELSPQRLIKILTSYFELSSQEVNEYYATAKVKGWLKSISSKNSQFKFFFDKMKTLKHPLLKKPYTRSFLKILLFKLCFWIHGLGH